MAVLVYETMQEGDLYRFIAKLRYLVSSDAH